ncbi:MAG: tetratricopeptide repeat protein [Desulfobacterales bacterium]|jgi:tetratricopeptide (TPR) repeat protein
MTPKTACTTNSRGCTLAVLLAALLLAACQKPMVVYTPTDRPAPPARPEIRAPEPSPPAAPTPQQVAARQLTEEGRKLLAADRADDAITVLERALSLDAENGRNHYFLGEAWLRKQNFAQAREFNRLAELYFRDNPEWLRSVARQRSRIDAGGQ